MRLISYDTAGSFHFAPLQGKLAGELGLAEFASKTQGTMVVLREADGKIFMMSDALIEVARVLGGRWKIFMLARFIPKLLRDFVYQLIADNRFRLAKKDSCALPSPELLKRLRE